MMPVFGSLFFDLSFMPLVEEISPRLAAATTFIALTNRANMPVPATICDLLCYEDVIAGASDDFNWPDFDDQTIAALCGIAGRATEQDSAVATLLPAAGAFVPGDLKLSSQDIVLSAIPMSHVDGWGLTRAAWAAGAALVFAGPWLDGRSLHALVEGEGVTVIAARPQVWQGLLAHVEREGAGLGSLRLAILTGDFRLSARDGKHAARSVWHTGLPRPDGDPTPQVGGRGGVLAGSVWVTETASDTVGQRCRISRADESVGDEGPSINRGHFLRKVQ